MLCCSGGFSGLPHEPNILLYSDASEGGIPGSYAEGASSRSLPDRLPGVHPGIPFHSLLLSQHSTTGNSKIHANLQASADDGSTFQVSARTVLLATGFWSVRRVKVDGGDGSFVASNTQVACRCNIPFKGTL